MIVVLPKLTHDETENVYSLFLLNKLNQPVRTLEKDVAGPQDFIRESFQTAKKKEHLM